MTDRLRRPAAVGVLVSLLLLLGWWQLLWQPQGAALAAAHTQGQQASTDLVTAEQAVGHLKHLQTISPKLTALEQQLSNAAPPSDELDQFLLMLNSLAQASGVTIASVAPTQPTASSTGLETMIVHLSGQGDYFAVQHFLDTLRSATRLIVVDSITESPGGTRTPGSIAFGLGIHLFAGLAAPSAAAQQVAAAPPTTVAPTGIISGPVTKAKNAVNALNAKSAQLSSQATATGGP
jgi:Tfp pilus assembly protein PilO